MELMDSDDDLHESWLIHGVHCAAGGAIRSPLLSCKRPKKEDIPHSDDTKTHAAYPPYQAWLEL